MKILLLGSTGRIGRILYDKLCVDFDVRKLYSDYCDLNRLSNNIGSIRPDLVINCAGYTGKPNVDSCLDNKMRCLDSNYLIPRNINICSKRYGFRWIHLSSGCIYNGYDKIYDEDDEPNFVCGFDDHSFYSTTKAFGELAIDNRCHILRIRMPFSTEFIDGDYIHKILNYEKLISNPNSLTFLDDFIDNIKVFVSNHVPFGIYNMVNSSPISAMEIIDIYSTTVKKTKSTFITDEEFNKMTRSKRSNCVLSNQKSIDAGCIWSDIRDAVRRCILSKHNQQ